MDGITLLKQFEQAVNQMPNLATWPTVKQAYDYLYEAAVATADKSGLLTTTQTITTVADQANYKLSPDYLRLYLHDNQGRLYIKYYDGTSYYFIYMSSMESIILANQTTSVNIPSRFAIRDRALATQITGTTTGSDYAFFTASAYSVFGQNCGETELTDSAAPFATVNVGDIVHNTSASTLSTGYVVATSSTSELICALFGDVDYLAFRTGDKYVINPQKGYELYLDPPPSTTGDIITVYYVKKPEPVYSAYRRYPFPSGYSSALVQYATWLMKYRDKEHQLGDSLYKYWDAQVRQLSNSVTNAKNSSNYKVSFVKRADKSWSYR